MKVSQTGIEQLEFVPVAPLRDRFLALEEAGTVTAREVCVSLGAGRRNRQGKWTPDVRWLKRDLGLVPDIHGPGRRVLREYIGYEKAVRIAHALGVDPYEVGV